MKKLVIALLSLTMLIGIAGCEKAEPDNSSVTEPAVTDAPAADYTQSADDSESSDSNTVSDDQSASENSSSADSFGAKVAAQFKASIEETSDIKKTAEAIVSDESMEYGLVTEDCTEGFLPGFSADITGFKSGVKMQPMIGSIPLVMYIFEADDAAAFLETLKTNADPRWNICTEAKETVSEVSGNYVFFAMCPGEEDF